MASALSGLAALHPRDEIEIMLGVQAVAAYQAASANWYLGMNHHFPRGDSTRHMNAAASAARTFDTLLKAMERRQARPLTIPPGRPPCHDWPAEDNAGMLNGLTERIGGQPANDDEEAKRVVWTVEALRLADETRSVETLKEDYAGLDLETRRHPVRWRHRRAGAPYAGAGCLHDAPLRAEPAQEAPG
ncbi:MAG: hypothetical protein ACJ8AW_09750 [Rhodopila sp.]